MARAELANQLLTWFGSAARNPRKATAFMPDAMSLGCAKDPACSGKAGGKSDAEIDKELSSGVEEEMKAEKTSEEDLIDKSFGHQVIRHETPPIDIRNHDDLSYMQFKDMGNETPGGDIMGQTAWQKWKHNARPMKGPSVPPEEDWYLGAKLGEMARPLIMGEGKVGYLNQAPVPMSPSEDLLTLMAEAGVGSRRARHAAMYAKMSVGQAEELFRLAQRRARQIFHDPPISVRPGADVYPFYSATSPVTVALATPPSLDRYRHLPDSRQLARSASSRRIAGLRQSGFL